nr:integrase, catalytic region, zinc finger, CCHC-type, peptidase aspartic, catalytic [Tanacetum cinerariifolium]
MAKVSVKEIQKKYQPKVTNPKKVGIPERLATPKPRNPRFLLRWSPTGKLFDQEGKPVASSESKSQSDCSNGDNACTSNTLEPKIKRFPNSTSFLDRLFRFVYGQFCDSDLEVAFRRNACFVRNLEGVDLLKGDRSTNLYTINLHELASASLICLMARASSTKSWLWHQRSSHLNFDTRNDLVSEFKNQVLKEYFDSIGISHQMSSVRTPQQNGVVERRNRIIYNRRTKKIMETMNVSFDEFSTMAFEQRSSKPGLQSMTSGQISLGLDLTYALSTITTQQPTEGELDLLFEAMYDDYIGGQPSATARTVPPAQEPQVRQMSTASTTIVDTTPNPTNLSSHATIIPITLQDVDELNSNTMVDGNTFINPFANSSTSVAESSSSQNVDPSNMHTFYQPYP